MIDKKMLLITSIILLFGLLSCGQSGQKERAELLNQDGDRENYTIDEIEAELQAMQSEGGRIVIDSRSRLHRFSNLLALPTIKHKKRMLPPIVIENLHLARIDLKSWAVLASANYHDENAQRQGVGIHIKDSSFLTLSNPTVHGFKWNIHVETSKGIIIEDCDVSFSAGQVVSRLVSPFIKVRDPQAWYDYGAGIFFEKSNRSRIKRCRSQFAQNGVILMESENVAIRNSDFSFNSGFGVGLQLSSNNEIVWNRMDYVNRPFNVSSWGGDSSAIMVANSSHHNYFIGNSLTHSGDGFFLTNRYDIGNPDGGSSDDNIVAFNDGSWSPNNAFEGTFSYRNVYFKNLANSSNYGYWLGYAKQNVVFENVIKNNRYIGIAIEHGEGNHLLDNNFENNGVQDVKLFGDKDISKPESVTSFKASDAYVRAIELLAERPEGFKFYRELQGVPKGLGSIKLAGKLYPMPDSNRLFLTSLSEKEVVQFYSVDYPGGDYKVTPLPNPRECKKLCSFDMQCKVWAWRLDSRHCFLKNVVNKTVRDINVIAGTASPISD